MTQSRLFTRNLTCMKRQLITLLMASAASLQLSPFVRASETTDPVGFTSTPSLANSDTLISVPLIRPTEFGGTVQSIGGSKLSRSRKTQDGRLISSSIPRERSRKLYYVLFGGGGTSNPKEGHTYKITSNDASSLTVDTSADTLGGITANTQLMIVPYWTLGTVFPASKMGVYFTATTLSTSYKTQILIPSATAVGINLPVASFFFSNNVDGTTGNIGWRLVGDNFTSHDDDLLLPSSYFIVRNGTGAPTLSMRSLGAVLTQNKTTILRTSNSVAQDNAVSMVRPIGVTLNQTGLSPADGSFVGTPRPNSLRDQLLLFNNAQVKHNKKPSAIYFYYTGTGPSTGWKLKGAGTADHGNDLIPAGSAIVIRKARTAGGASVFWTNVPTVLSR